jgi:guanylate kinase
MTRKGILFVISGPSGVGKGTVREALLEGRDDIQVSISASTRPPRSGEIDGRDYFFIDRDTFLKQVEDDQFLEWASVYSNLYGTPREFVVNNLSNGRDVLLEIDIQGALQVKRKMPEGVFIFISPPSIEALAQRLCGRGKDSQQSIEERLAACEQEMQQMGQYDYVVVNDQVEKACAKVEAIIIAERCRIHNLELG